MKLEERYQILDSIQDAATRQLLRDVYSYMDEIRADLELIHRAVAFSRWLGPIAVAILLFALGRVWGS